MNNILRNSEYYDNAYINYLRYRRVLMRVTFLSNIIYV